MFIIRFASRYPFLTGFIHRCEDFLNRTMKVVICFLQLYFLDDSLHFPSSILLLLLAEGKRGVCLAPAWGEKAWKTGGSIKRPHFDDCLTSMGRPWAVYYWGLEEGLIHPSLGKPHHYSCATILTDTLPSGHRVEMLGLQRSLLHQPKLKGYCCALLNSFYPSWCTNWGLVCDWWAAKSEGKMCALPNFMSRHEALFGIEKKKKFDLSLHLLSQNCSRVETG